MIKAVPRYVYHLGLKTKPFFIICFLTVAFLCAVFVHRDQTVGEVVTTEEKPHPTFPKYTGTLVVATALLLAHGVQAVLVRHQIVTPYGAFVIMIGYLLGVLIYYNEDMRVSVYHMSGFSAELMAVYVPICVFDMAFNVDVPTFKKTVYQILVIGAPVSITCCCLFGIISGHIIEPSWSIKVCILFGIFCSSTCPHGATVILKQQNIKTKQISTLLEGEAIIVFFISDLSQKLLSGELYGYVRSWHQFAAVTVRILVTGSLVGYVFGRLGRAIMCRFYTNRHGILLISIGVPFFAYHFSEVYVNDCGTIAVIIVGLMLSTERMVLPKETKKFVVAFWEAAVFFVDAVVMLQAAILSALDVAPLIGWSHYPLVFVIYMMYFVMRLVSFLLFSPIISKMGYGMDFRSLIVCVWGGIKSTFALLIGSYFLESHLEDDYTRIFQFYAMGVYFLSVVINGSLTTVFLNFLGLRKISLARQVNMNNCMKHIFTKRETTIAILKTDRFLADANWPLVILNTNMKHPYYKGMKDDDGDGHFLGYRFTWCGDCKKDILQEPTPKEFKEMTTEAKMRILKAKKMSYSRQYAMGMLTKAGIIALGHKTEMAMDSEDVEVDVGVMHHKFVEENWWVRFLRTLETKCVSKKRYRRPRTYWRRLCYNIVLRDNCFEKAMLGIVFVNVIVFIIDTICHPPKPYEYFQPTHSLNLDYVLMSLRILFVVIYIIEFGITILAYSWVHICRHGFRGYFTNCWHVQDFFVMWGLVAGLIYDFTFLHGHHHFHVTDTPVHKCLDMLRYLRAIRLIRLFFVFYENLMDHFNKRLDAANARAFEIVKCYSTADAEILEMLPYMIDNKKIRRDMKNSIEKDRLHIYEMLGIIQKERPWVAITVKTTQAIRMILHGMKEATNQLKSSGWVDTYEYEKLTTALEELYKGVNSIKKVQPSPPNILFKDVPWMESDDFTIDFLFDNVVLKKFEPGDIVFAQGVVADGVYIVVTGLFAIYYIPNAKVVNDLKQNGLTPIVDFINNRSYEEKSLDHVISGTSIGELSCLTGRPYDCVVKSDGHSQAYFISLKVLKRAMELSPDPVTGLERRMWKEVGVRIATPALKKAVVYQTYTQDQIKYALERAFVPDLSNFKIFAVSDMIEDVVLIEGVVMDFNTKHIYIAPCYVPRMVQKLVLSQSSHLCFLTDVKTNLLIIPAKDSDEYDIMLNAEEVCELVRILSDTKCLQHLVQDRKSKRRKTFKTRQKMLVPRLSSMPSTGSSVAVSMLSSVSGQEIKKYSYDIVKNETNTSATQPSSTTLYALEEREEREQRAIEYTDRGGVRSKSSLFFS